MSIWGTILSAAIPATIQLVGGLAAQSSAKDAKKDADARADKLAAQQSADYLTGIREKAAADKAIAEMQAALAREEQKKNQAYRFSTVIGDSADREITAINNIVTAYQRSLGVGGG